MPAADLDEFLKRHRSGILHIQKPVALEHVGALTAQSSQTIVFENLKNYPVFRLVDLLFVNREAQARVLGCDPGQVVPRLSGIVRQGPKPLVTVADAPCQERVLYGRRRGSGDAAHRAAYTRRSIPLHHQLCHP